MEFFNVSVLQSWGETAVLGNTVLQYFMSVLYFFGVYIALWILQRVVIGKIENFAKKTKFTLDDAIIGVIKNIGSMFYIATALFVAIQHLTLPEVASIAVKGIFLLFVVHEVIKVAKQIVIFFLKKRIGGHASDDQEQQVSSVISILVTIVLWSLGVVMILSNIGFDVTSLIAGLGIGGIAVSLALQNILSDLFSSFSIALDKPFKEGDFIIVGPHMGVVKHIGLKTTRILALQGEEIVISNNELTSTRIQNFKKMERRRIVFVFGVTYDTPADVLEQIGTWVEEIVSSQEKVEFDRSHFKEFADSSLNYETVYYLDSSDYTVYMDTQQAINLSLVRKFEKEGVEMAFPTRTVYMKQ